MEPAPKKISANVPINSATSFCGVLYMEAPPKQTDSANPARYLETGNVRLYESDVLASNFGFCRDRHPLTGSSAQRHADRRKAIVAVRPRTVENGEKFFLEQLGDGPARSLADLDAVDRAQGTDFSRGAGEEDFVGDVEHLARNQLLAHRDFQVLAYLTHGTLGDARQDARYHERCD